MPKKVKIPFLEKIERLTAELEEKRRSVVTPLFFTTPITRPLVSDIYDFLLNKKKMDKCETFEIILHSSGGNIDAAYHLAKILRSFAKKQFKVIVPRFAKSAATLLACAGDVIVMERPSEIGTLEPIIDLSTGESFSPLSINKLMEFLDSVQRRLGKNSRVVEIMTNRIPIMQMGDCLKTATYAEPYLRELLNTGMFKNDPKKDKKVENICKRLIYEYPEKKGGHGYIVDVEDAQDMGLKIERPPLDQWKIIWKMFRIFETEVLLSF